MKNEFINTDAYNQFVASSNQRKIEEEMQEMRVEFKAVMKDIEYSMKKIDALSIQLANKKDKK